MINYQGRLLDSSGDPVKDSTYEIKFSIYNQDETSLWDETLMVPVSSGLFNVTLGQIDPLGEIIIVNPPPLFLGIQIGAGPELEPRTPLSSGPYALRSLVAEEAVIAYAVAENTIHDGHIIDGSITLPDLGQNGAAEGQIIKMGPSGWMIADDATGPPAPDEDWILNGGALYTLGKWGIARAGNNLWGNNDSTHVNLGVDCTTGASGSDYKYSTVSGGFGNIAGQESATIGGGMNNSATGTESVVCGGRNNQAMGNYSFIGGGWFNEAYDGENTIGGGSYNVTHSRYSTIGGGYLNKTDAPIGLHANATVAGGHQNEALHQYAAIGGGGYNHATAWSTTVAGGFHNESTDTGAVVCGGGTNYARGRYSAVVGGGGYNAADSNAAHGPYSFIGGGTQNLASSDYAVVSGGNANVASGYCSAVLGGVNNKARGGNSVVVAGGKAGADSNSAVGNWSVIDGGYGNIANGTASVIGGGLLNQTINVYSTVAGGTNNIAGGSSSAVCGGESNYARGHHSFVGGGGGPYVSDSNSAMGNWSVIPGGSSNLANGDYSFAAGRKAQALHDGCLVWADNTDTNFASAYENEIAFLATNGMRVYADNTGFGMGLENNGDGDGYRIWSNASRGNNWAAVFAYNTGTSPGIYAYSSAGYAAYFEGDINVTGTVVKAGSEYKIDHPLDPENRYLSHSSVSSPDIMNVYNGNIVLDANGEATVILPDYFEALNRDFRYQLTAIGAPGPNLYIADEINGNRFRIAGGQSGMKVSWQVTGIRDDAYANAHRSAVETDKPFEEQGNYLHPEAYGQSAEMGIIKPSDHESKRILNSVEK